VDNTIRFRLTEEYAGQAIDSIVAGNHGVEDEKSVEASLCFYDTFDWRLFAKSLTLCQSGRELTIRRLSDGKTLASCMTSSLPRFVWDFADGPLRRQLAPIVGERRLFPVGEACIRTTRYHVFNAERKIVVRLARTEARSDHGASIPFLDTYLVLLGVRGYPGQFRRLVGKLKQAGLSVCQWEAFYRQALAAMNKQPGSYSAKPDYQLAARMRADVAAKTILRQLLAIMQVNEDGIKMDYDTEFLHDYRTAIRRTRSALSQIKGVFPPQTSEYFLETFARLGEQSNRLRDLDVYLLSEPVYQAMLPDTLRNHLAPLFDRLRTQRQQALQETIHYLNSAEYACTLSEWEAFLNEPILLEVLEAPNATLPAVELARRRIYKRYGEVIQDGRQLHHDVQDEWLHALRIDCKKLRYLLEFFANVFPQKQMDIVIGQLKVLQNDLGEFNDLAVQQAYLWNMAESLPADDIRSRNEFVAIGYLVKQMADDQNTLRTGLNKTFAQFAARPNRKLFRQLFKG